MVRQVDVVFRPPQTKAEAYGRAVWKTEVALLLIGSSAVLPLFHVFLLADLHLLLFYLSLDVVFVPIQVLPVTVLIERLMDEPMICPHWKKA